jgi:uncharacterized protein YndB with AHSA1/START domain
MNEFTIVTDIDRPVTEVFRAIVDLGRTPEWTPGLTEVRVTSEGAIGAGSTMVYVGKFLGRAFDSPAECVECVTDKVFSTKSSSGPFYLEVAHSLVPDGDATRVTSVYRGESRGFFKLAEPVIVRLTKKQFEMAMESLKSLLEADAF